MCLLDIIVVIIAGSLSGVISGIIIHGGYVEKIVDYIERLGK